MDYSIHDAIEADFNHVVFIIRKDIENEFKEVIGDRITWRTIPAEREKLKAEANKANAEADLIRAQAEAQQIAVHLLEER